MVTVHAATASTHSRANTGERYTYSKTTYSKTTPLPQDFSSTVARIRIAVRTAAAPNAVYFTILSNCLDGFNEFYNSIAVLLAQLAELLYRLTCVTLRIAVPHDGLYHVTGTGIVQTVAVS